ncbi:MAG: L-histidine N(alpha)-methyltransferase [Cyclobacteriaceae bacterium]
MQKIDIVSLDQFSQDVLDGLSSNPKKLSSKYFYDERGDELFQQIMNLDEYYLSRAELEIFNTKKNDILEIIDTSDHFRLLELGAGDGAKTKVLLRHFRDSGIDFTYAPVDISENVLQVLSSSLEKEVPGLNIEPLAGDYFKVLNELKFKNDHRSLVFFLGSNIGNFLNETAISFLSGIRDNLKKGDLLMIGFDLKKDPQIILNAYNDKQGVTEAFNKNLLRRINEELEGNFELNQFDHHPIYDPLTGQCRSYLISKKALSVRIEKLDRTFHFEAWEPIFMEVSKKYSLDEINYLATNTGFKLVANFFDGQNLFCDSVWQVE